MNRLPSEGNRPRGRGHPQGDAPTPNRTTWSKIPNPPCLGLQAGVHGHPSDADLSRMSVEKLVGATVVALSGRRTSLLALSQLNGNRLEELSLNLGEVRAREGRELF